MFRALLIRLAGHGRRACALGLVCGQETEWVMVAVYVPLMAAGMVIWMVGFQVTAVLPSTLVALATVCGCRTG